MSESPTLATDPAPFVVSEAQFDQMFPNRQAPYTYAGLVAAMAAYPDFATTGNGTVQRQEAAAFLANVSHETGGLVDAREQNPGKDFCDPTTGVPCPAGKDAYYGRGSLMLSWNYNYKHAGDALGTDLLDNPDLVATDEALAWKTGLWYWTTQNGPAAQPAHSAMVNGLGFGQTIMSINGGLECGPNNPHPDEMNHRVKLYKDFCAILGVDPGSNLTC